MMEEDYIICGFIEKLGGITSLVLGQYRDSLLCYKGHVTMGVTKDTIKRVKELPKTMCPFNSVPVGNENAIWVKLRLVCSVEYMPRNQARSQPVFKGLRNDKTPIECVE